MSRKSKKKPQAAVAGANAAAAVVAEQDTSPHQHLRLSEVQDTARRHLDNDEWLEILALGRLPVTDFHEDDRHAAEVWLLRARILGLYPPGVRSPYDLAKEVRAEYEDALQRLASRVEALHTMPSEFGLYLDTLAWSPADGAKAFKLLTRACMELTNLDWLRRLRSRGLRLLDARDDYGDELSEADRQALSSLPDVTLVLSDAYAATEAGGALDEEGQALVKVLRCELDLLMAEPWDYGRVADALLRLPAPTEAEALTFSHGEPSGRSPQQLTPKAWAFLWELENTAGVGLVNLLTRYQERFACDACEGLRQLLMAFSAAPGAVDGHVALAVNHLMRFADASQYWFGQKLTVLLAEGIRELDVGSSSLHMASVEDLLLRLFEHAPNDFARRDELECLYRIYSASVRYSPLEDEDKGEQDMPGLAWLCEQNISFQFACAYVVQGVAGRMRLLLDAIRRTTSAGVPPSQSYYSGTFDEEELSEAEAESVLDALEQLSEVRERMDDKAQRMWREVAGDIFDALSKLGEPVRKRLLPIARDFSDDLLEKGKAFRLAFLEQVVGEPEDALHYYLIDINKAEVLPEVGVKNAKLLWAKSEDLSQVQALVDKLEEEAETSRRADTVKQLLADAKARLAALNKRDQFERTAVSRWPSLTAPARKLLSVFATIKSYTGLGEVAEYAGMDLTWAGRHYEKLVELGMLLVTDKTFRVNPHIAPLLERESQHSVIGRIVRSQGTSAVKQVFNSQREFNIYQVLVQLCPNHLVFPNCSLQSVMSYERMKELVSDDDFGYYLRASVDIVVVSSTTYLPMLAIEVDSVWHDTERQQRNDDKKDRLFAAAGVPFMRLRPVGSPSEHTIRAQVAEHVDELVRSLRVDLPGYDQTRGLLEDLSGVQT